MKGKGFILLCLLLLGGFLIYALTGPDGTPERRAAVGAEAPAFELRDIQGKIWKLSDLKGKAVILNFWATWCDTCREEKEALPGILANMKGKEHITFLTVIYRDTPENITAFMKRAGLDFPALLDDGAVARAYGITGVPETFLINRNGILEKKIIGPVQGRMKQFRSDIERMAGAG